MTPDYYFIYFEESEPERQIISVTLARDPLDGRLGLKITGTPAGVGPLEVGQTVRAGIDGLASELWLRVASKLP